MPRNAVKFKLPKPSIPELELEIDDETTVMLECRYKEVEAIFHHTGVNVIDLETWQLLDRDPMLIHQVLEIMNRRHQKHDAEWFQEHIQPGQWAGLITIITTMWLQAQPDLSQLPEELRRPTKPKVDSNGEVQKDDPLPEVVDSFTGALATESSTSGSPQTK